MRTRTRRSRVPGTGVLALALAAGAACAQESTEPANPDTHAAEAVEAAKPAPGSSEPTTLPDVQVVATRSQFPRRAMPAAVSVLGANVLRDERRGIALGEKLATVPGVLGRQRNNYAQDEQLTVRGFGARATFGIRGVRLYQDGIPATMPDGQGQVSHFALGAAGRIEVLRGPFSALYGNAAGGVVQVFTVDGRESPGVTADLRAGSDGFWRAAVGAGGASERTDWRIDASRFHTDGYRDHSRARRDSLNGKLELDLGARRTLRLVFNGLSSPDTQDPLGLTAAQMREDPRQVAAPARQFDTRKSVRQAQLGALVEWPHADDDMVQVATWAGERHVEQFLAVPVAVQSNPLHGGGVVDVHGPYAGFDASWEHHSIAFGDPFDLVVGFNFERQRQFRRGFENFDDDTLGVRGALRRDEANTVAHENHYVQLGWRPHPDWYLYGGLRRTWVRFRARDKFVTAANPDDSGSRTVHADIPVFGASWRARPGLHAYVAVGTGFETPTFDELGYRTDGGAGLNFDLDPARTLAGEVGVKWDDDKRDMHAEFALFRADTHDELAVAGNSGGRSTFRNAGSARRQGLELSADMPLVREGRLRVAYTWLDATYVDGFLTCAATPCTTPTAEVPAGTRLPGLPRSSLTVQARWGDLRGWTSRIGVLAASGVRAANVGDARADGFAVLNASLGYGFENARMAGRWFVSVDNAFDRRYAGSVIVNEANGRYFEPASGRTFLVGGELRWK